MTETSPLGSVSRVRSTLRDRSEEELADLRAPRASPPPLVDIRIVDRETDKQQPWDGESAERSSARARGSPRLLRRRRGEQFTDRRAAHGRRRRDHPDGYIKLVDRTKDLVKSGGEWISSVELENEIMAHPKVEEAAVIGIRDDKWGERPLACVVPEEGAELDAEDIRGFLDGRVAKWWIPESSSSSTRSRRRRSASSPRRRCASSSPRSRRSDHSRRSCSSRPATTACRSRRCASRDAARPALPADPLRHPGGRRGRVAPGGRRARRARAVAVARGPACAARRSRAR